MPVVPWSSWWWQVDVVFGATVAATLVGGAVVVGAGVVGVVVVGASVRRGDGRRRFGDGRGGRHRFGDGRWRCLRGGGCGWRRLSDIGHHQSLCRKWVRRQRQRRSGARRSGGRCRRDGWRDRRPGGGERFGSAALPPPAHQTAAATSRNASAITSPTTTNRPVRSSFHWPRCSNRGSIRATTGTIWVSAIGGCRRSLTRRLYHCHGAAKPCARGPAHDWYASPTGRSIPPRLPRRGKGAHCLTRVVGTRCHTFRSAVDEVSHR